MAFTSGRCSKTIRSRRAILVAGLTCAVFAFVTVSVFSTSEVLITGAVLISVVVLSMGVFIGAVFNIAALFIIGAAFIMVAVLIIVAVFMWDPFALVFVVWLVVVDASLSASLSPSGD